jgi:hypothetical protein
MKEKKQKKTFFDENRKEIVSKYLMNFSIVTYVGAFLSNVFNDEINITRVTIGATVTVLAFLMGLALSKKSENTNKKGEI